MVSAITHTPASGPRALETNPPISSPLTFAVASCPAPKYPAITMAKTVEKHRNPAVRMSGSLQSPWLGFRFEFLAGQYIPECNDVVKASGSFTVSVTYILMRAGHYRA